MTSLNILSIAFFFGALVLYTVYFFRIYLKGKPPEIKITEPENFEFQRFSHTVSFDEKTVMREGASCYQQAKPQIKEALVSQLAGIIEFDNYFPRKGGVEITGQIFVGVRKK